MDCWFNLYKPIGSSSARLVSMFKRLLPGNNKVGHCGTLDLEAEGILPLAVGEATKLVRFLVDAKKTYIFTIKFGIKTDTADRTGNIIATTSIIPSQKECEDVCSQFIGTISQTPPAFSAIKVRGIRSYKLAREKDIYLVLPSRKIIIYSLKCIQYDTMANSATYVVECSKGTYVRTLGEDIALHLQSLAFVIELRRICVGQFSVENSFTVEELQKLPSESLNGFLDTKKIGIETVLDDILVLHATSEQAKKIRYGQMCNFDSISDIDPVCVKHKGVLLAIGHVSNNCFISARVFNLINMEVDDVDYS